MHTNDLWGFSFGVSAEVGDTKKCVSLSKLKLGIVHNVVDVIGGARALIFDELADRVRSLPEDGCGVARIFASNRSQILCICHKSVLVQGVCPKDPVLVEWLPDALRREGNRTVYIAIGLTKVYIYSSHIVVLSDDVHMLGNGCWTLEPICTIS